MYVEQLDFFMGTGMTFVKKVMGLAQRQTFRRGETIFREGDPASHLYVLLEGRVRLIVGRQSHVVYVISRGGEAFGWSSLVGRSAYSASAACVEPTRTICFGRDRLREILQNDPANGILLYKGLAKTLAARLLETYRVLADAAATRRTAALGSGQFGPSNADEDAAPAEPAPAASRIPPSTQGIPKVPS